MFCPQCHHDNPTSARFCSECGTRLSLTCPACQKPIAEGQKFCSECGTRLAPMVANDTPPAERKRVTVLFADIVDSTAMAQAVDAEVVHDLYNGALQRMSHAVTEMGGTVGALMGDGMMAIFGAPVSHEDDAERAALAALRLIDAIKDYTPSTGQPLQVRVGLNTGRVMMGEMGGMGRTVYTAVGDVVNLASRLEHAAAPNTVLIGETTWRTIAHRFEGQSLGTLPVKGMRDPVPVYRVLDVKAHPGSGRGLVSEGMRAPLIGRTSEYDALQQHISLLTNDAPQGGVTAVVGEAGIGKSRLVAESAHAANHDNLLWLEGRSLSYTRGQPHAPWAAVVRQWLNVEAENDDIVLFTRLRERLYALMGDEGNEHLPFLASLLSIRRTGTGRLLALDAEARQVRLRLSVVRWLSLLAQHQPLVLVFEDLHWADPSSLALLEQAMDLVPALPIRIIAVSRINDADEVMALSVRTQARLGTAFTELWLNPLNEDESSDLITCLLQWQNAPVALLEKIRTHADGNPFFVEEIIRALIDEGVLAQRDQAWELTRPLDDIALPPTIEAILTARIDRLDPAEKEIVQRAAVVGRVFWRKLLAEMPSTPADFNEALYQLSRQDLIRPRGWRDVWETEYIFRHVLTQEAAYRSIPHSRRRTYHREVARAMEGLLWEENHDYDGVLAGHWEQAGDAEMALRHYDRAARHAADRYANAEAVTYYDHALALLSANDKQRRFDLLEQQQLLFERLGQRDRRQQSLDELLSLAEGWRDKAKLARVRAYRYLFDIYQGEGLSLTVGMDETLMHQLQTAGERDLLLELLELVAIRYWWGYSFPFDRAKGLARQQQALTIAEQTGDDYRTFINRALLADMRGHVPEAEMALQRALQAANHQGDLRKQWTVYHRLGRLLSDTRASAAIEHHERAMTIGRQMADTRLELISADNLGLIASKVGDYQRAYHTWQRAYELQVLRGQSEAEQAYGLNKVVFTLLRSGRVSEARTLAAQSEMLAAQSDDEFVRLQTLFFAAEAALLGNDLAMVEQYYRSLGDVETPSLDGMPINDGFDAYFAANVGQWYAYQGNWEKSAAFLSHASTCFTDTPPHPMREDDEVQLTTLAGLLTAYRVLDSAVAMQDTLDAIERVATNYKGREYPLIVLYTAQHRAFITLGNERAAEAALNEARTYVKRHAATFTDHAWQAQFLALHTEILEGGYNS